MSLTFIKLISAENLSTPPKVPPPLQILIFTSSVIQLILGLTIILAYFKSPEFRKSPGSIILGFAISEMCLAICWAFNFQEKFLTDPTICPVVGFFSILFEYTSIFYELGILCYFLFYSKNITKKFMLNRSLQDMPPIVSLTPELDNIPVDDNNLIDRDNLSPTSELLLGKLEIMQAASKKQNDVLKQIDLVLKGLQQERNDNQRYKLEKSNNALSFQIVIHSFVIFGALALTLMPTISNELGADFYNACSKEWAPDKMQSEGITWTIVITAFNTSFNAFGLAYLSKQNRIRQAIIDSRQAQPEDEQGSQNPYDKMRVDLTDEQKHYLSHLRVYVILTTILGWAFAGTNIYADRVDAKESDGTVLTGVCVIVHFLMIGLQGLVILVLKITEPLTLNAIRCMFRRDRRDNRDYRVIL